MNGHQGTENATGYQESQPTLTQSLKPHIKEPRFFAYFLIFWLNLFHVTTCFIQKSAN